MSLAPEHVADLRKSGLDDATITACGFASVRPHDLRHLAGVESAYALPYFNLDKSKNCVSRLKLFPPITDAAGHKQKYHQPKDSVPSLYLTPTLNWMAIAADAQQMITITEGEKKAASLCQRGTPCVGVAGTWNWRQRLDTGDRMVIPMLDQFGWKSRKVELIPDSDLWRPQKRLALAGFYALAMELIKRGAVVAFVVLPETGQAKVGLDDWLVKVGRDWENLFPVLERTSISDVRFQDLAKWWQQWTERQVTESTLREQLADDLVLTETVGLYTVKCSAHALTLLFDQIHTRATSVIAEVTVIVGSDELRSGVDLNLKSDNAQVQFARNLHARCNSISWKVLIPRACTLVLKRYRQGAPLITLDKQTVCEPFCYTVNPLVPKGKVTVLFGAGGLGKSTLALMVTLLVSIGGSLAGISAVKGKGFYLDWEDSEDVHARRLHGLQAAHPELREGVVLYRRATEPLSRMVHELGRIIQREGITFLVVDSLLAAAGGGSDAEHTEQLFAALRVLNISTLILGHVAKAAPDGQHTATIYGSVFNSNFSRSVWELQAEQDVGEDSAVLALLHRKTNLTRKHPPIGLLVRQSESGASVCYEPHDLTETTQLEKALPLAARIRNLLDGDGTPRTSKEVAEALGAKLESVRATLSKHKGYKWSLLGEHGDKEAVWTTISARSSSKPVS